MREDGGGYAESDLHGYRDSRAPRVGGTAWTRPALFLPEGNGAKIPGELRNTYRAMAWPRVPGSS